MVPHSADPHGHWNRCKQDPAACDASQIETLQGYYLILSLNEYKTDFIKCHKKFQALERKELLNSQVIMTSWVVEFNFNFFFLIWSPSPPFLFRFQAWHAFSIARVPQRFNKWGDVHKFMLCSLPKWVTRHMVWSWLP